MKESGCTDPTPDKRDPAVDFAKGVAITGVLLAHAGEPVAYGGLLGPLQFAFGWCVTTFFFFSGYLESTSSDHGFAAYLRKRAVRLLIPFIILHLVNNLGLAALTRLHLVNAVEIQQADWCAVLLSSWSPQLYFLPWLFVVGGVLWFPLRKFPQVVMWLSVLTVVATMLLSKPTNFGFGGHLINVPAYVAAFAVGFALRRRVSAFAPILLLLIASAAELFQYGSYRSLHPLAGVALLTFSKSVPVSLTRPIAFMGIWSFAVFLWHAPLAMPAVDTLVRAMRLPAGWHLTATLAIVLAACLVWGRVLVKTPLKFLGR